MIIWSGFGILLPIVFLLGAFLSAAIRSLLQERFGLELSDEWAVTLAVVVGTLFCWILSLTLAKTTERTLLDPATRKPVVLKSRHTLFFIPVRFYCWLGVILSLGMIGLAGTGKLNSRGDVIADSPSATGPAVSPVTERGARLSTTTKFPARVILHSSVSASFDGGIHRLDAGTKATVIGFTQEDFQLTANNRQYTVKQAEFPLVTVLETGN